uniref:FTH domain-containing protein n=1 Tax=Steinernema glaseri TaxID=37863 RepID=A0A1I7YRH6_9BILA
MDTVPVCFVQNVIRTMVWLNLPPIKQLKQLTKLTSYFGSYASFYDENAVIRMAFVKNGRIEHFIYDEEGESYKPIEEVKRRYVTSMAFEFCGEEEGDPEVDTAALADVLRQVGGKPPLALTLETTRLSENVLHFLLTCNTIELWLDVTVEGAASTLLSKLIAKGRLVFCGASEGELNEETSQALLDLLDQDQFQYLKIGCYRTARRVLDHWKSAKAKVGRYIDVTVRPGDSPEFVKELLSSRAEVTSREEKLAIYSKLPYLSDVSASLYEWKSFHNRRRVYFNYYPNLDSTSLISFGAI